MSSLDFASLPPAGASISPSNGAPSVQDRSAPAPEAAAQDGRGFFDRLWGEEGFGFGALLDIVNPLQHIPVVGTVYRAITGDTIGAAPRIAGGALFGGVIGLVAASIDAMVEGGTGKDVGEHMLALREAAEPLDDPFAPAGRRLPDQPLLAGDFSPREAAPTLLAQTDEATRVAAAVDEVSPPVVGAQPTTAAPLAFSFAARAPQEAANGAGGVAVPLTTMVSRVGRVPLPMPLPAPQTLAADPALLREMQATRAATEPPRNAARIDTTIRADVPTGATASFLDYTPMNAALRAVDGQGRTGETTARAMAEDTPPPRIDPAALPQVPADLISRMNMALEKYQTMQRATERPAVDIAQ